MAHALSEAGFWVMTALAPGRLHGYAILQNVAEQADGGAGLKATTLYAVLERLTDQGLVVVDAEEVVDGRTRRYFRLTLDGAARLQQEIDSTATRLAAARAGLRRFRHTAGLA